MKKITSGLLKLSGYDTLKLILCGVVLSGTIVMVCSALIALASQYYQPTNAYGIMMTFFDVMGDMLIGFGWAWLGIIIGILLFDFVVYPTVSYIKKLLRKENEND